MEKYSKEFCEDRLEEMRIWFISCIVGMILSVLAMHFFDGMMDTISVITLGLGVVFLVGIKIEKSKCNNILEELEQEEKQTDPTTEGPDDIFTQV